MRLTFAADGDPVCTRQAPPWECEWDAGEDVVAHDIRAVAVLADGSRLVDSVRTEAAGFAPAVTVDVVQVPATVTDGGGRLVKGLGPQDFRVYENERPQEISHFIGAEAERELVVAVDMSGSMGPAMTSCREAVKRFLATVRPVDHVTLLAFNDSVFTVARREATPEARLRAVDRLRAWGSTAFHDALLRGARSARGPPRPPRARAVHRRRGHGELRHGGGRAGADRGERYPGLRDRAGQGHARAAA